MLSQEETWFYIRAKDTVFNPDFTKRNDRLVFSGTDENLKNILDNYTIRAFKKTLRNTNKNNQNKTFFVISDKKTLLDDLLLNATNHFKSGEIIPEKDRKIFEPNDYGLTSTIGANTGAKANLDYLDFLGAPKAWYYTTGSKGVFVGISDGIVDTTNIDFKEKTEIIRKSYVANGHGYSISANAAAQGDNGYGIPGICYDCSIYSTTYGHFKVLSEVMELSNLGAKVVNCSWVGSKYYESAQKAINQIIDNGTLVVAAAGNGNWYELDKGEKVYYPASYENVISVSSAMYRNESVFDDLRQEENGNYYAENVRGYIGRTIGFPDNDTLQTPIIHPVSVAALNKHVDILAPTVGLFRNSQFILKDEVLKYSEYETTSGAAPLVTGTIGLMLSLSPCLPIDEVESILKMTAMNIDHIDANKQFEGNYGAGILQTGDAVEMVYQMFAENETVTIDNQNFSRWDFKLTTYSEKTVLKNQQFTDAATLNLTSKNQIVLSENTVLKPNREGSIHLKIDSSLQKECELQLRDPSILKK